MSRPLLVTGVGRSGTTLVEKLLHAHPACCIASQPFAELFIDAKRMFLAERGVERPNPLGTRFLEDDGTLAELEEFLDRDHWDGPRLDRLFAALTDDAGQRTASLRSHRAAVRPGTFFDVHAQLLDLVAAELGGGDAEWVGSKEVFFEELGAILVGRGGAMVLVVRDPRDVVSSFRYGTGRDHVGAVRPTLFLLRQWRKSVAFALHLRDRVGFALLRYEDVVERPVPELDRVARRLGIAEGFAPLVGSVRDQEGRAWAGNSSFGERTGLSRDSVGTWRRLLDPATVRYVDAVCGPELAVLGYASAEGPDLAAIDGFAEPVPVDHPRFAPDDSTSPGAVAAERRRLELLSGPEPSPDERRRWFIFPEVYDLLRTAAPIVGAGSPSDD